MLFKASWCRWQEREHVRGARVSSGKRSVTQHIGRAFPSKEGAGVPLPGSAARLLWEVVAGVKRQSPAFLEVCEPG